MTTPFFLKSLKQKAVILSAGILSLLLSACLKGKRDSSVASSDTVETKTSVFKDDVDFLVEHTKIIELQNSNGNAKVAVSAALQGRVMTSTSEGDNGFSYGWINRAAFLSGDTSKHFNAFGGEDRLWLWTRGRSIFYLFRKRNSIQLG